MKLLKKILSIFLAMNLVWVTGCSNTPKNENDYETTYNVIFTLATIPPVIASLESIASGNETFALIERGKTYSGIDSLENFHNVGFDPANNLSEGFTEVEFTAMVEKVKEVATEETFFNFYVQDGTALLAAGIAANAGLTKEQFHVYMIEDGTGAYQALRDDYANNKKADETVDEPYDALVNAANAAKAEFETVMSKTDNAVTDAPFLYNIGKAYALATLDNFTFYLQDEGVILDILKNNIQGESKLLNCFGVEGYKADEEFGLNLKYKKISTSVSELTEEQKDAYLTLMYGQYKEDTEAALTRTERADQKAPSKKLVFIGSRHGGYPHFASNAEYGIGGLAEGSTIPATYAELDSKYKNALLFATEADYTSFLAVLNNADNYVNATDEAKAKAQVAAFNTYIDYIYNLKLTYSLYGVDYDLIMKGHPREVIGGHDEWGGKYLVALADGTEYCYDKLLDNALLDFHANDSTGKYIGMVPYGTAAENLAYFGVDLTIGGLPSSTYAGYDLDVDVLFILAESAQDILGSGQETIDSSVNARYEAGNLVYTDKDGNEKTALYLNTGNALKCSAEAFKAAGNEDLAKSYETVFQTWLNANHAGAKDIDEQGFAVK